MYNYYNKNKLYLFIRFIFTQISKYINFVPIMKTFTYLFIINVNIPSEVNN